MSTYYSGLASSGSIYAPTSANGSGYIAKLNVDNQATAERYFQLFDSKSIPVNGNTPILSVRIALSGAYADRFPGRSDNPVARLRFSNGISWGMSTTAATYTSGSASEGVVTCLFVPSSGN